MKRKEIEECRQKLVEIQKLDTKDKRVKKLQGLAKEVGVSIFNPFKAGLGEAGESELIDSITQALCTETMIDMCKVANRNFIIALVAAGAAILSALGALILAFK